MDELALGAVSHYVLKVADLSWVPAFYGDLLGLREVARHQQTAANDLRSIWYALSAGILSAPTPLLMIERAANPPSQISSEHDAGWNMLVFAIAKDQRQALAARLQDAQRVIFKETDYTFYLRDDEGNALGFSHYPLL